MREMIIGENYERNITLIRSHISRFSRGTDGVYSEGAQHLATKYGQRVEEL